LRHCISLLFIRFIVSERTVGVLFLASAAIFWSLGGLLIKLVDMPAMAVAGGRSAIAALVIWAYVRRPRITFSRGQIIGAVAYAGTVAFFVMATKNTTAANAILLQYTAPVWVALASHRLLGEPIGRIDWLTIVLALGGMALFMFDGLTSGGMAGNVLAVVSGIFFAGTVIGLRMERHGSSIEIVLLGNILTAVIGLPFAFGSAPGVDDLLFLLILGVVQLGLGYIFFVKGVARVSAIESALIPVIEPILNPLWVALFHGELPTILALVGGAVVVGAVTARGLYEAARRQRVSVTPHPPPEGG
jgi:drug/metabolite transporter (DMT)-like permease